MTSSPLEGVRVVDLTVALAGPFATHLLGHFGADVVKVESPEGDIARGAGGQSGHDTVNPFVIHTSRSKRSIVLDLKDGLALQALARLLERADVFVTNLRPAALARMGITYEFAIKSNPRIIYCSIVGFGSRGRYSGRPAYDDTIQGTVGIPWLVQRMTGGEPQLLPSALADRVTAITAYGHIVTALLSRSREDVGRFIEVPMFETMAHFVLSDHLYLKSYDPPRGPAGHFRLLDPNRRPYRTSDGYICVLPTHDKHWSSFFSISGRSDLTSDPRFADISSRMANVQALYEILAELLSQRSTSEWLEILNAADIPASPVNSLDDLIADPHLRDVQLMQKAQHQTEGSVTNLVFPGDWSDWNPNCSRQAPRLGEHSLEILQEIGCSPEQIAAMVSAGATVDASGAGC